ncbi:DeoR family transcriptional regulator [Streptomyces sp. NPDC085929]|uniref:DeoR family transcriptional regulator n=1 Tax=Streptomyces sp. NPDC085929 TaxID=3365739 RepID=UPI0037D78C2B
MANHSPGSRAGPPRGRPGHRPASADGRRTPGPHRRPARPGGYAATAHLVRDLKVSRMTIHRDLTHLAARGEIHRIRSDATAFSSTRFKDSSEWHHGYLSRHQRPEPVASYQPGARQF